MWSLEFGDVISHVVVCLVYAHSIGPIDHWDKSPILQAYFAFWIINLYSWALPLYPMIAYINDKKSGSHVVIAYHIMAVDFFTDLPILIITLSGRTYVNNAYISFDIAVKIILFLRGCIWTPIVVFGDRFKPMSFGDWTFSSREVVKTSLMASDKVRFRSHSV